MKYVIEKIGGVVLWAAWFMSVGIITLTLYLLIKPMDYLEEKIYGG